MKALMYIGEKQLRVEEVAKPEGEFLVRVLGTTICGTDLKTYLHGHPYFKPPTILGHEFYGQVEKAPAETGYAAGDYVVVAPYGDCGECEACLAGNPEMCKNKDYVETGSFCEYIAVPLSFVDRGVIKLNGPERVYALAEPLACILTAYDQLKVKPTDRVLIIGGGPMGTLFALTYNAEGVDVRIAEINELRRNILTSWGIQTATLDECYAAADYDKIIVAVNKKELVEEAVAKVRDGGTVHVFAGLPSGTILNINGNDLHYRKVSMTGSSGFSMNTFHRAFEFIKANPANYERMITHVFPLEKGEEAFDMLRSGEAFKIMIES